MALQHLRSSTANKRPLPAGMSDGQLAINTESTSPGLFFKNSGGNLVKVGPVHVGTTAPNATPASGGQSGNSTGELWLDTSLTPNELKTWDGSAWVSATGQEIPVSKLIDGSARQLLQTDAAGTGVEWTSNVDVPGTLDVTGAAVFDSSVAVTGTLTKSGNNVVTVGDTGTVTSTMILDGTIVNDDVNASAAIAGTKISPNFGSQNVTTTGTATAASFIPTSSTVPTNGVYLPAANSVAISTNGTGRLFVDANGKIGIGETPPDTTYGLHVLGNIRSTGNIRVEGTQIRVTGTSSASAPAIQPGNDADTGIFHETNTLGFSTTGTERFRITSDGKLGIGTTSPNSSLEVRGGEIRFGDASASATSAGRISYGGGTGELDLNAYSTGGSTLIKFFTSSSGTNAERARITSDGRLGIGTSSPSQALQVAGAIVSTGAATTYSADGIYLQNKGSSIFDISAWRTGANASILTFSTDSGSDTTPVERMRINLNGNVGIGTTSPTYITDIQADGGGLAERLRLFNTGSAANDDVILQLETGATNNECMIWFGDSADNNVGQIRYNHSSDSMEFHTAASERARIDSSGRLLVGTSSDSGGALLQVNGDRIRVATAKTPASATATGTAGEICWDANYIYVCTATNTWKRAALSTW